jgi:hypothetical protein
MCQARADVPDPGLSPVALTRRSYIDYMLSLGRTVIDPQSKAFVRARIIHTARMVKELLGSLQARVEPIRVLFFRLRGLVALFTSGESSKSNSICSVSEPEFC